jgi:hypothetical protein
MAAGVLHLGLGAQILVRQLGALGFQFGQLGLGLGQWIGMQIHGAALGGGRGLRVGHW